MWITERSVVLVFGLSFKGSEWEMGNGVSGTLNGMSCSLLESGPFTVPR